MGPKLWVILLILEIAKDYFVIALIALQRKKKGFCLIDIRPTWVLGKFGISEIFQKNELQREKQRDGDSFQKKGKGFAPTSSQDPTPSSCPILMKF